MMYRYMYASPISWIPAIFGILFWILVIALVISLVRHSTQHETAGKEDEENQNGHYLNIVKERYAKGEINKEKYEELKEEFSDSKGEESKKE